MYNFGRLDFPNQHVSYAEKQEVDTEAQKATIENLIAQTSNEKTKKGLILGQIRVADAEEELKRNMADWTKDKADETRWNIKSLQKGIDKLTEEINGMKLDNELKERTIDNKVKESSLTLRNLMAEILLKGSQQKVLVLNYLNTMSTLPVESKFIISKPKYHLG